MVAHRCETPYTRFFVPKLQKGTWSPNNKKSARVFGFVYLYSGKALTGTGWEGWNRTNLRHHVGFHRNIFSIYYVSGTGLRVSFETPVAFERMPPPPPPHYRRQLVQTCRLNLLSETRHADLCRPKTSAWHTRAYLCTTYSVFPNGFVPSREIHITLVPLSPHPP